MALGADTDRQIDRQTHTDAQTKAILRNQARAAEHYLCLKLIMHPHTYDWNAILYHFWSFYGVVIANFVTKDTPINKHIR